MTAQFRDVIAARRRPAEDVEIGPDEVHAVALFFALATQWVWHNLGAPGASRRVGLNYAAIPATALPLGIQVDAGLFEDLRVMEAAALAAWAK